MSAPLSTWARKSCSSIVVTAAFTVAVTEPSMLAIRSAASPSIRPRTTMPGK